MFMRTQRLFLRPVFPEDWRDVYRGIADFDVVKMLASAPWPYAEDDAQRFCSLPHEGGLRFAITAPDAHGAPVIGLIGMNPTDESEQELGYWIAKAWQGRGYASEAVAGILAVADALHIPLVEAGHYADNPASGKVLKRNGFGRIADARDTWCQARGEMLVTKRYERRAACASKAAA